MRKTFASFIVGALLLGSDLLVQVTAVPMNASATSSSASLSISTTDGSPLQSTLQEPPADERSGENSQFNSQGGFTPSVPYNQQYGQPENEPTPRILQQRRANTKSNQGNIRKFDSNNIFKNVNLNSQQQQSQQQSQSSLPGNTLDDPYEFSTPDAGLEDVQVVHHGNSKISYEDILKSIASGSMPTIPTTIENPANINHGNNNHQGQGGRKPSSGNYQNFPKNIMAKLQKTGSTLHHQHQAKPYVETETHHHVHHVASGHDHHDNHDHHLTSEPIHHDHHAHHDHHGHHHHHDSHYHGPIAPVHHAVKSEIHHPLPHHKNLEAHAHISLGHDHGIGHHHHLPHHGDYYHHHGHSLVPAIGKAIKFLIPSALFITGASALFPKRVHVPTNYVHAENGRKKRFAPEDVGSIAEERFDSVPSEYLRKEHRAGDDDGIELVSDEDYADVDHDQFGDKMPEEIVSQESSEEKQAAVATGGTKIPAFKPMPTPTQASAVPVIKLNKMVPIPEQSQDGGYDAFNFEDYVDAGKVAEMEPQKVATTEARQNTKSLNFDALPQPTPGTKPKLSPQDAMSQLLKITMSASLPTVSSTIASDIKKAKSLTSLVVDQVAAKPKEEIADSQVEPSHDKPIFRQYSTDSPKVFIVTPEPKGKISYGKSDETPDKIVSRRNADSHSTANISSVFIRDGPGPSLILLGGENNETENSVGTEKADLKNSGNSTAKAEEEEEEEEDIDLSPDSPVVGLITNYAMREKDSPQCQKRALCELAVRGSRSQNATKFERFLWNLANLVPGSLSGFYDLDDTFAAIKSKKCKRFRCSNPNLDLQEL